MAPQKPKRQRGLGEASGKFVAANSLAALFEAYGNACAFTGRSLLAEAAADPRSYLIHLRSAPTTFDPATLIPACLDAIYAFERRHLAVGPRYNLLADLETISPELLEALNPIGRLILPSEPALHPSQAALTPHLIAFLRNRGT